MGMCERFGAPCGTRLPEGSAILPSHRIGGVLRMLTSLPIAAVEICAPQMAFQVRQCESAHPDQPAKHDGVNVRIRINLPIAAGYMCASRTAFIANVTI